MKKLLLLMLIISLILCMFSCSNTMVEDDSKANNVNYVNDFMGDRPLLNIQSYSEYKKFIKKVTLPENFIYYENIEDLGEFQGFVCLTDARIGDYSQCMYTLYEKDVGEFTLYVDKNPFYETEHTKNVITDVDKADMRSLDMEISGTYQYKNIRYVFLVGKLHSIKWKSGEWYYTISSIDDLKEDTSKANISKLFNLETAPDLIASVAKPEEIK